MCKITFGFGGYFQFHNDRVPNICGGNRSPGPQVSRKHTIYSQNEHTVYTYMHISTPSSRRPVSVTVVKCHLFTHSLRPFGSAEIFGYPFDRCEFLLPPSPCSFYFSAFRVSSLVNFSRGLSVLSFLVSRLIGKLIFFFRISLSSPSTTIHISNVLVKRQ